MREYTHTQDTKKDKAMYKLFRIEYTPLSIYTIAYIHKYHSYSFVPKTCAQADANISILYVFNPAKEILPVVINQI
jgi:hypothetical protein